MLARRVACSDEVILQFLAPLQVLVVVHKIISPLPYGSMVDARVLARARRKRHANRSGQRLGYEAFLHALAIASRRLDGLTLDGGLGVHNSARPWLLGRGSPYGCGNEASAPLAIETRQGTLAEADEGHV